MTFIDGIAIGLGMALGTGVVSALGTVVQIYAVRRAALRAFKSAMGEDK